MTPARARAMYARQIAAYGETITMRRGNSSPLIDAQVRARVSGYKPERLIGLIQQGDREVIILAADLAAAGWPVPPRKTDKVLITGGDDIVVLTVLNCDDSTASINGVPIAYIVQARG